MLVVLPWLGGSPPFGSTPYASGNHLMELYAISHLFVKQNNSYCRVSEQSD